MKYGLVFTDFGWTVGEVDMFMQHSDGRKAKITVRNISRAEATTEQKTAPPWDPLRPEIVESYYPMITTLTVEGDDFSVRFDLSEVKNESSSADSAV